MFLNIKLRAIFALRNNRQLLSLLSMFYFIRTCSDPCVIAFETFVLKDVSILEQTGQEGALTAVQRQLLLWDGAGSHVALLPTLPRSPAPCLLLWQQRRLPGSSAYAGHPLSRIAPTGRMKRLTQNIGFELSHFINY